MAKGTPDYKALFEYACVVILAILIVLFLSHCKKTSLNNEIDDLSSEIALLKEENQNEYDRGFDDGYSYAKEDVLSYSSDEYTSSGIGKCYQCNQFYSYNFSGGLGLCSDCADSKITTCMFCDNLAYLWEGTVWDGICPHCMGIIAEETQLYSLLETFAES